MSTSDTQQRIRAIRREIDAACTQDTIDEAAMAGDPKAYIDDIVIEGIISMGTRGSNEELARWRWFVDLPRSEQRAWVRRAQPWLQGDGTR